MKGERLRCPKCHAENTADSRFCSNCATPLNWPAGPDLTLTRTLETPVRALKPGNLIADKYRIVEEIGHGGMGVVFKAEDIKLKRSVALKFLPPHLADSPDLKQRFLIEAQAAAALSHPNICVIYEVGEDQGRPYIAMEYVEGETLGDRMRRGPLKSEETLAVAVQVASGLGEAHRKSIIHRDIKSANIMVTPNGQVKVMDFGLAKLRGGSSLTQTQTTLGTVAYMSPEQARGEEMDHRTDIWSLGVVLYQMLTGELPFKGDHDQTVIYAILHREPKPPSKIKAGLPSGLDAIILRALDKKRDGRYPSMEDLREDLEDAAEGFKPLKAKRRFGRRFAGWNARILLRPALAVVIILFGLNVGGFRDKVLGRKGGAEPAIKLAVLPFANLTGNPEQEYLSDGLTQEMIGQLGRLHPQRLSVIARTSVMRYKGSQMPIDQIGRELGVQYVLEGSARREGNRLRISAELVRARDQVQLWGDIFEREMSGILALQNDVAANVAKALALTLLPDEQARLGSARTVVPESYDAFMKGSFLWQKMKPADLEAAQRYFELALEKDPSYAPAQAGLSWVWAARAQMGIMPPLETGPEWKRAALRAVAMDDGSADAHEALAGVMSWYDWDWAGAWPEWRRTIELNPNNANAQAYYSHFLANVGRIDEAIPHIERALALDPSNALYHSMYAGVLNYHRRYDEAVAAARKALAVQPDAQIAFSQMELALDALGRKDERLGIHRKKIARDPERLAAFEKGLAEGGYEGALRADADVWAARYGQGTSPVGASGIAELYRGAGEKDLAIDWLEKAFEDRDGNFPYIGRPIWDPLRDDPRFRELMRKLNLPGDGRK